MYKAHGLGTVYIVPKRFKCSFAWPLSNRNNTVCEHVNLKNNIEEFQTSGVPFPVGIFVHLKKLPERDWIFQNLKKGKAKWQKSWALKLSASK